MGLGLGQACLAWCVHATASGRQPQVAVEDALQVVVLLPLSDSNGMVCSCCCVWSLSIAVEVVPSRVVVIPPPIVYGFLFLVWLHSVPW